MELIKLNRFKLAYSDKVLIKANNINIQSSQKIGLIGNNGVGKTSLLRVLMGENDTFIVSGNIIKNCKLIMVPQIMEASEKSGGEQEKAAIISAFSQLEKYSNSLLMLDEPTSNLDISQQNWLVNALNKIHHSMIIVSHDRNFLNKTVNTIWSIQDKHIRVFKGNYSKYHENIEKEEKEKEKIYLEEVKKITKLKRAQNIYKERALHATKKKRNMSQSDWKIKDSSGIQKRLFRVSKQLGSKVTKRSQKLKKPKVYHPITLKNFAKQNYFDKKASLVRINKQSININNKKLFQINNEIKIKNGDKIILSGKNGSGKSVFLSQLVDGNLDFWKNSKIKIGYFNQNLFSKSRNVNSIISEIQKQSIFDNTTTMQLLGDLHLTNVMTHKICTLSGGELICYKLAKILLGDHNFLVLDEPTNFLDITSIRALESFIKNYPFALILVSHDKSFINNLNFKILRIHNNRLINNSSIKYRKTKSETELQLLKFRLNQMIQNEKISFTEIQDLKRKIEELEGIK